MLEAILKTVAMIGSDLPAYKVLFDDLMSMLSDEDQATAREAYDAAMKRAEAAHKAAQAI